MARVWINLMALLLLTTPHANVQYCAPAQRYDVAQFPPRCLDCPKVVPRQMQLIQISAVARTKRAIKFSPGLPQNQTCGCWRSPANQTIIDVALNASWIVSGLVFNSNRGRWLRQLSVQASADNATFVPWGTYTARNFSDAATTFFSLPIRAQYFRITVLRYANHYVNDSTTGFPLAVGALVTQTQPFDCDCPRLSDGRCCPHINMTVRNDTCVWCMDPALMSTVVVHGCGRCRIGTYEHHGQCIAKRPNSDRNEFRVAAPESNGVHWTMNLSVATDPSTALLVYLTRSNEPHPCAARNATAGCLGANTTAYVPILHRTAAQGLDPPLISNQYLQFDRGRYTLNMTQPTIRAWATCGRLSCAGYVGAVFVTQFPASAAVRTQTVVQPLRFNFAVSSFVATFSGLQTTALAKVEVHRFRDTWALRVTGVKLHGECVHVRWGRLDWRRYNHTEEDEYKAVDPPPAEWDGVRIADCLRTVTLHAQQPMTTVVHDGAMGAQYSGITVQVMYGLNHSAAPSPGDSEQLVFITAKSPQPIRLKRMAVVSLDQGISTSYTTPKGFIIDSSRVLDLAIACAQPTNVLMLWITRAMWILNDSPPSVLSTFIRNSCAQITENRVSKAYWLIPARAPTPRTIAFHMNVVVEFG